MAKVFFEKHLCTALRIPQQQKKQSNRYARSKQQLLNARRISADLAFVFALLGIGIMVLAMEFELAKRPLLAELARWTLLASTIALLTLIVHFHFVNIKYHMHLNAIRRWQSTVRVRERVKILLELVVCALCPLPLLHWSGDAYLCALMFLRLYWLPRVLHLHSRLSTDATAKSIAALNGVKTDTRFFLKRKLFMHPAFILSTFVFCFWLIVAYILRLCESNVAENKIINYFTTLWMMCVNFLTNGDVYPVTICGRLMAIVSAIVGVCVASMLVAVIVQESSFSQAEERLHRFMTKNKHSKKLKIMAAQVLEESWLVYKHRRLDDQKKLRFYLRRQSVTICAFRKLRKEQRMLKTEDVASIDDVARKLCEVIKLIRTHQANDERMDKMDRRLDRIQRGIAAGHLMPNLCVKNENTKDQIEIFDENIKKLKVRKRRSC